MNRLAAALSVATSVLISYSAPEADKPVISPVLSNIENASIAIDRRAQFGSIYCSVLSRHVEQLGECSSSLWTRDGAKFLADPELYDGNLSRPWRVVLVSGFASDCLDKTVRLFGNGRARAERIGASFIDVPISGLASSEWNAKIIAETIEQQVLKPGEGLMLVGYSKGFADALAAVALYPDMMSGVDAMVSVSGAFGGSRLADRTPVMLSRVIGSVPGLDCNPTDALAIASMRSPTAGERLARYTTPSRPPVFSLASIADESTISPALRPTWRMLTNEAGPNDGQLTVEEQIPPGTIFLGYVRADHWSVALPIEEMAPGLAPIAARAPFFPQSALSEAIVRFVDEYAKPGT